MVAPTLVRASDTAVVARTVREADGGCSVRPRGCRTWESQSAEAGVPGLDPEDEDARVLLHECVEWPSSSRLEPFVKLASARLDAVKRANDTDRTYDESGHTDQFTLNMLRYSGIRCRTPRHIPSLPEQVGR